MNNLQRILCLYDMLGKIVVCSVLDISTVHCRTEEDDVVGEQVRQLLSPTMLSVCVG